MCLGILFGLGVRVLAEGQLQGLVVGIILFTLVSLAAVSLLGLFNAGSGSPNLYADSRFRDFNNSMPTYAEAMGSAGVVNSTAERLGNEDDVKDQSFYDILFKGGIDSYKSIKGGTSFITTALYGVTVFGIPGWVIAMVVGLIAVVVSFAVIGAVFNRNL